MADIAAAPLWRGGVPDEAVWLSHAFEGFRAAPYRCAAGVWTIGLGSTLDAAGRPVTPATPRVTRAEAEALAKRDLAKAAERAAAAFPGGLPPRWGAVVVLMSNNMGSIRVWGRTLHRLLLAADWRAAAEFMRHYRNAGGVPVLGLRRRRWAEAAFALGMEAEKAVRVAWARVATVDDWPALPG
jgi:lysozyme